MGGVMMATVLFIDDDPFMLKALQRTARRLEPDWLLLCCERSQQWQAQLTQQIPDLVICDYLMPLSRGDEVLGQVRQQYPLALRVLLTGDASKEVLQSASQNAHVVLGKPFNEADLQLVFQSWRQLKALPLPTTLRAWLGSELQLPALPAVVRALRREFSTEQVDLTKVAELLAHEPVLPARLFQLANSALLGFQRPTHSLVECLLRLGLQLVEAVVTLYALDFNHQADSLLQQQVNERAFNKASISRTLAQAQGLSRELQEQLFVAALLSAIGPLTRLSLAQQGRDVPEAVDGWHTNTMLTWYLLTLWGYEPQFVQWQLQADSLSAEQKANHKVSAEFLQHGDEVLILALAEHISQGISRERLVQLAQQVIPGALRQCLLDWPQ